MSRYLTPSKISLLALISLYADSVVPATASIPILSFIVSHLLPVEFLSSKDGIHSPDQNFVVTIECLQKATITHPSEIPGRTVWDLLLKKLWEIDSFDALHVFFDSLSLLLERKRNEAHFDAHESGVANSKRMLLSRSSPFGVFVRRSQLEFTRLQFHDGIVLWKGFILYRNPTLVLWRKRNPRASKMSFDTNLQGSHSDSDDRLLEIVYGGSSNDLRGDANVSTDDVEKLLEYQIARMQKMGNRLPKVMEDQFRSMTRTSVVIPSLSYYARFLDSWKAGDYPSSFDNLHRYFDYTMHNRDRTFYQYALLNLAILHADFGCYSEAIAAMRETISAARENNDMTCLNYSLSWLYHFGKAHPEETSKVRETGIIGADKEAIAFLKAKAKETGMWSLLSTSFLSEAKLMLSTGESAYYALECILKASHLNVTKNISSATGSQMMMRSALFGRLGVSCQAWLCSDLFTECYAIQSPTEDMVHSICRSAYLLAQKGRYDEALLRMDGIDQEALRTLKYHQYWTAYLCLLKLQRHLHRDDLLAAEHVLSQVQAIPFLAQDLFFAVTLLKIDLHVRREDFSEAFNILEDLATKLNDDEADIFHRIKTMILKARIFDKVGIAQKGFSVALRAARLAYQARLLPALWEAVGAVSRVLISVEEFKPAAKLLESIIPQVLECEDCDLAGSTFSYLADAHMGIAGQNRTESSPSKERLTAALECIDRSFDEYSRIEDIRGQCEMMAKKATIMHLIGDPVLANDYSAKYLDMKRAAKEQSRTRPGL